MSTPPTETPEQLFARANRCLREGRAAEGIEAYERLLALRPALPDCWYNLAYLQRCDRRFEDALASYRRALDHGVRQPEAVHVNRAAILSEHLERGADAEAELRAALAINPGFVVAWLNLGNLYEDWGDREQARVAYERALRLAPASGRALARLATIDAFDGKAAAWVPRLRETLAVPGLPPEDAAEIGFALGHALDAVGAYDEAFAAFAAANDASRRSMPPTAERYDRAAQERLIDELIRVFPLPVRADPRSGGRAPVFVCGMFRSGSTLAEQILGRHSGVTVGGELEFVPALVRQRLQPYPASLVTASPRLIQSLRDAYLADLDVVHPGAGLVTDKRPDNFLHVGLIKAMFPDARIVHTRRRPLDNILSVYFLHFDHSVSYGLDLGDIAHWYGQYRRLMRHWKSLYPDDIHDFDYDDAVLDPRPTIERLLDFCGLDWEEACLATHATRNPVRTASVWQVRQPLHQRSSGRWRNYADRLGDLPARFRDI